MRATLPFSLLFCLSFSACQPQPTAPPAPTAPTATGPERLEMRAYAVPQAVAGELANVMNRLLYRGKESPPAGKASVGPGGQLLVTAPVGVQAGIKDMLARMGDAPPEAPPTVEITYWVVEGQAGAGAERAANLNAVAPALDAIAKEEGDRTFTLLEKLRVQQVSGSEGKVTGREIRVGQTASVRDGKVVAQLWVDRIRQHGELNTQVALPLGKLLVLGQAGGESAEKGTVGPDVYYIVRAAVLGE
jgi:hypothetical protein